MELPVVARLKSKVMDLEDEVKTLQATLEAEREQFKVERQNCTTMLDAIQNEFDSLVAEHGRLVETKFNLERDLAHAKFCHKEDVSELRSFLVRIPRWIRKIYDAEEF